VTTTLAHRVAPVLNGLRRLHSGHVGDYVTWVFVGLAVLCAFVVLPAVR
jgi:multicomponent Na+:H+ antiporter subunit D